MPKCRPFRKAGLPSSFGPNDPLHVVFHCQISHFASVFTTYEDVLAYLYASIPMFQRVGSSAYKGDLTNTIKLCDAAGNPQSKFKSVHVAGTNGKGSTSHMLASVLQQAGYKTGLYTSPHLKSFTERIRLNGDEITKQFVVDFVNRMQPSIESIKPSFFEVTVVMAFDYFAREGIDVAVIEVGLGGRLDSTNVITPEVSVITNIGWDHMDLLGDTLEKIAFEKAGIIKKSVPVVISEKQKEVEDVFIAVASEHSAPLFFATDDYTVKWQTGQRTPLMDAWRRGLKFMENVPLPLQGYYQQQNVGGVLKAIELLHNAGFSISHHALLEGLTNVISNTRLKGRWQKLGERPLMICDTGHNIDGMRQLVRQIHDQPFDKLHMVIGMVKDKDITKVLELLPVDASYYFCQADLPRALDAELLAEQARKIGLTGVVVKDVNEAIRMAKSRATSSDFIFIGGSTFVVAEIENL